ncbi:MAG TPA: CBS domain-containing protein [Dehalococcoidia bacterium]
MSARAAARLEGLGFRRVYRYTGGKADWFAAGLPREGREAGTPRAGDLARRDIPACLPDEGVGQAWERAQAAGWSACAVVDRERVVLGLLRARALTRSDPSVRVEDVMHPAPRTYRAGASLDGPVRYMRERGLDAVLITTPDGVLIGMLRRADAEPYVRETDAGGA